MSKRETIHKELDALQQEGTNLAVAFHEKKEKHFQYEYQSWYTKALKAVATLAPDRYAEFRAYYEIDPKRKALGYGTYVIQDFVKNVSPNSYNYPKFDTREHALRCFLNQITILSAIQDRVKSTLADIEGELYAEIQDGEISVARQLSKVSLRAAGALVGVLIEGHLQRVANARSVKVGKKNPTIADLNDALKAASAIDVPAWRKVSYLADIRNLCSHKKETEPTKEQVEELIQGADWLTKNLF
jgi:hypothetical protein